MPLSTSTLSAIQKAGTAVFAADAKLKAAAKHYAQLVNTTMQTNPYHESNDAVFENWKLVARLSQTMAGIEEEIKKVYQAASKLIGEDNPTLTEVPALAAPVRSSEKNVSRQNDLTATDVVVKQKAAKPVKRASKARAKKIKPARSSKKQGKLGENPSKLLRHFETILNPNEFIAISQTAVSNTTGIPLGSMTAAIKKLTESGQLIAGPTGSFKLANIHQSSPA